MGLEPQSILEGELASGEMLSPAIARVIDVAQDAVKLQTEPIDFHNDSAPTAFLVSGQQDVKVVDLTDEFDARAPRPRRVEGKVQVYTVQSLLEYVARHLNPKATTCWVPPTIDRGVGPVITAVLDDHQGGEDASIAEWGRHRADLHLQITDAWQHWLKLDGQLVTQEAFAEHIEDGQVDIAAPDGAELLEIVQTFQQTTSSTLRSATRLTSGLLQFEYVQDGETKAGVNGDLEIPATFLLQIAPFIGEAPVALTARLRYRTRDGNLQIGYKLDRPDDAVREALDSIAEQLRGELPAVYIGKPRA